MPVFFFELVTLSFLLLLTSLIVAYFMGDAFLFDAMAAATSRTVNRGVPGLDEQAARTRILENDAAAEPEPGKNPPPTIVVGETCPPYVPGAKIVLLRMKDGKAVEARTCLREYKDIFFGK
jgi:hypothetical protein